MPKNWYDVVVIGGGPGGYAAAIRASQLGANVILTEKSELGGVCTNVGCIPTKTLLRGVELYSEVKTGEAFGINFSDLSLSYHDLLQKKDEVVKRLRDGVQYLLKANGVEIAKANGVITAKGQVTLHNNESTNKISTESVIIATGSRPNIPLIPGIDSDDVLTSDKLLSWKKVPKNLLIIGGGPECSEFTSILNPLGCKITIIEMLDRLLPSEDRDLGVKLASLFEKQNVKIFTSSKVKMIKKIDNILQVHIQSPDGEVVVQPDNVLIASGRRPNVEELGLEALNIEMTNLGISVDEHMETNVKGIFAVGDVVGGGLAHVAFEGGVIAAENTVGLKSKLDLNAVPRCIYSIPEIATVGISEAEAEKKQYKISVGRFSFQASGRSYTLGDTNGFVKIICESESGKILGAQIMAKYASELISEVTLAIKMGITVEDLVQTIHPHPSLSEALKEAALDILNKNLHNIPKKN